MANVNVNAPAKQAPIMAPPTCTDDPILPRSRWSALQITPINNNNPFSSPPTPDALINFVHNLGYPKVVRTFSVVVTNDMFQSKKKANPIVIPNIRFTKLIIHHLQSKHKFHPRPVFGIPIPNELITADIQGEQYYKEYMEKVVKHQRYLVGKEGNDPDSPAPKPAKATKKSKPSAPKVDLRPPVIKLASSQQPKPKPAPAKSRENKRKLVIETFDKPPPAKRSKPGLVTKRRKPTSYLKSVDKSVGEGIPEKEPRFDYEEADIQRVVEESLKSLHDAPRGPLPPMVIREPDSRKFQPLIEVSPAEQYIFQRRTPTSTEPSGHAESPSIYLALGLTDNDLESDEEVPLMVKENLKLIVKEHVILEEPASSTGTLYSLQHHANDFSFGDLFFNDKPSDVENEKITAETEAESMVSRLKSNSRQQASGGEVRQSQVCLYTLENLDIPQQKKKRHDSPKTPPGSPPHQLPPPPPAAGPSGTSRYPGASGSSQVPPLPPLPSSINQESRSHGFTAPSSSKTTASAEYTAWTTTNIRLEPSVSSIPKDLHMDDDMALDEHVHSSDDEDIKSAHIPKASALASTYTPPPENSLLTQTGDMAMFMYQIEECHKLLTDSMDESIIKHNVSKPLPLGGPPGQVTIQSDFFFNKDLEYLRYDSKGGRPALSILKMKVAYYPDVLLEQMVPDHMWVKEECKYDIAAIAVRTHMRILSVVRIEVFSTYGGDDRGIRRCLCRLRVWSEKWSGRVILYFSTAHDLVVVKLYFKKRDHHLITFQSGGRCNKIDYLLVQRGDLKACKDYRVFPKKACSSKHNLLVLDILFKSVQRRREGSALPRILWKNLNGDAAEAF
nr:ATPase, F1 complex alpha/beta subunit, N-terminal domain-containing protein [Tanacetum cinerariifolium]